MFPLLFWFDENKIFWLFAFYMSNTVFGLEFLMKMKHQNCITFSWMFSDELAVLWTLGKTSCHFASVWKAGSAFFISLHDSDWSDWRKRGCGIDGGPWLGDISLMIGLLRGKPGSRISTLIPWLESRDTVSRCYERYCHANVNFGLWVSDPSCQNLHLIKLRKYYGSIVPLYISR